MLENFNLSDATKEFDEQKPKPILEFSLDRFLRHGPFRDFYFKHTNEMKADIEFEDDRKRDLDAMPAIVLPQEGQLPNRNRPEWDQGTSRVGTYTISNSISWDIRTGNPVSISEMLETLLIGFKQKIYTDLTDIVAMAAQNNKKNTLRRVIKSIQAKSGRTVDRLFFGTDVEDESDHFFKSLKDSDIKCDMQHCIVENLQLSVDKTILNYDQSGCKPIIAVALNRSEPGFGTQATKTPFVIAQRGLGQIFIDDTTNRSGRLGLYGWINVGFACLAPESVGVAYVKDV